MGDIAADAADDDDDELSLNALMAKVYAKEFASGTARRRLAGEATQPRQRASSSQAASSLRWATLCLRGEDAGWRRDNSRDSCGKYFRPRRGGLAEKDAWTGSFDSSSYTASVR